MRIETGTPEDHPSLLPLDGSQSPALAPPTEVVPGQLSGPTYDARDTVADQQDRLSGYEAECRAAQASGMTAEQDRRGGLHADMLPVGADYGTAMDLPEVPAYMVPPASSDLYPWQGDEPTPAG